MLTLMLTLVLSQPFLSTPEGWMQDCGLEQPGAPVLAPVPPKAWETPWRLNEPPMLAVTEIRGNLEWQSGAGDALC